MAAHRTDRQIAHDMDLARSELNGGDTTTDPGLVDRVATKMQSLRDELNASPLKTPA